MKAEQTKARNEAYMLLSKAQRILEDAGLAAYAEEVSAVRASMETDAQMLRDQAHRNYPPTDCREYDWRNS